MFLVAGVLGIVSLLSAWRWLPQSRSKPWSNLRRDAGFPKPRRNSLIVCYAAAIWGSAGLWQWIVVFLTFQAATATTERSVLATGAVIKPVVAPAEQARRPQINFDGWRNIG